MARILDWNQDIVQLGLISCSLKSNALPVTRYSINVNSLRDPIGNAALRSRCADGRDPLVRDWIRADERIATIILAVKLIAESDIKAAQLPYVAISFVDHHGVWISPAVVEIVAEALAPRFDVSVKHLSLLKP